AARAVDIERDAALARLVEPEEEAPLGMRDALPEGRRLPHRIAARRLHPDDVGAKGGQQAAGERARLVGEVEDPEAGERAHHRRRKRSRAPSSVSVEMLVTRSLSPSSVPSALGPTLIRIEYNEKPRRAFSARNRARHSDRT